MKALERARRRPCELQAGYGLPGGYLGSTPGHREATIGEIVGHVAVDFKFEADPETWRIVYDLTRAVWRFGERLPAWDDVMVTCVICEETKTPLAACSRCERKIYGSIMTGFSEAMASLCESTAKAAEEMARLGIAMMSRK